MMRSGIMVVLSGGQDSTTCLFFAKHHFPMAPLHAITFNYAQRHEREIQSARIVAQMAGVLTHSVVNLPEFGGKSPLTNRGVDVGHYDSIGEMPGGVEPTFVLGRNIVFLAIAASHAAVNDCETLMTGVSQEDFGGYPDCRLEFINRMDEALKHGLGKPNFRIMTPLINRTKKETVEMARDLPGCMEALAYSHTCYDGQYPPNPKNHASILRAKGFRQAGLADPLILRAKREGLLPSTYPDDGLVVEGA